MEATLAAVGDLLRRDIHGVAPDGRGHARPRVRRPGMLRRFFEYELAPWDFAAGRLFVEEAGGKVTTGRGGPLPIAKTSVLASNGLIHEAVLEIVAGIIRELGPSTAESSDVAPRRLQQPLQHRGKGPPARLIGGFQRSRHVDSV